MPYYVFLSVIQNLGGVILSLAALIFLFRNNIQELFRKADEQCPRRFPSIAEIILKVFASAMPWYFFKDFLAIEEVALVLCILAVPLFALLLLGVIVNAYEMDSIRLFWRISLGDILGMVAIATLGAMISSMDKDPFMLYAGFILSGVYLLVKLAMRTNQT